MTIDTNAPEGTRTLVVKRIELLAQDIRSFELVHPDGQDLLPFTPGAHLDFHLPDGQIRQYSLCSDPRERQRYVIAVLREAGGRGGSVVMHDQVREGDRVEIGGPRNNFPLAEEGVERHLLLAGGIGVTPMMAMVARLQAQGASFSMHYCTKSPEHTAFKDQLSGLVADGRVALHHDGGNPADGLDIAGALATPPPGTHLYYCGPAGFMAAAKQASEHWPKGTVHFEYFSVDEAVEAAAPAPDGFQVRIASTGATFFVPADKTIVQVLAEQGIEVETSCESGLCGTCITRYLEGDIDHRDMVLDDDEQSEYLTVCCSRSKGPLLILDL